MKLRRLGLGLLWFALACCSQARDCTGCGPKPPAFATVIELRGGGLQRSAPGGGAAWSAAIPGAELQPGETARTDANTSAKLRFANGSELWLRPSSVVRFAAHSAGSEHDVDLITGEAVITAGSQELHVRTHVGLAVLRPYGSLQLKRSAEGLQLRLDVGDATFTPTTGELTKLARGESLQIAIGAAVLRTPEAPPEPPTPPPTAAGEMRLSVLGAGVSAKRAQGGSLEALAPGERALLPNTDLQLGAGASATVQREADRIALHGAGEYHVGDGKPLVITQRGRMSISARSQDVHVAVPGGWIVARASPEGNEYELRVDEREGLLTVKRGQASWNTRTGPARFIEAGKPFRWRIDRAAREENARTDKTRDATPPDKASFTVRAGESFVVHSPGLPVALGVSIERVCEGEGLVELADGTHYRGSKLVRVWLTAATRNYAVRCSNADGTPGKVVTRGYVQPLQDAGTRELPPRAPSSVVDADGRSYTIYYQNQQPDIRVRWPSAPSVPSYQLTLDKTTMTLDKPEHTFVSGSLRDGEHRLTFTAKERRSRTANVEVRFDNTTTTASLSTPDDRGFQPGAAVTIDGVALPAWKVSVDGGMIESTDGGRFHGSITPMPAQPDFAVRLSHPRLGTHYYVRRASESP